MELSCVSACVCRGGMMHSRGVKVCRRRKTDEGEPKKEKGEARGGGLRSGGLWGVDGPLSCRPLVMSYYLACPPSSCRRPSPRVALRVFSPSTHSAPLPFHCGIGSTGRGGAGLLTDDFEQQTKRYAALKPGGMNGHQCRCTACMAFVLVPHLRKRAAPYRFLALCRDFVLLLVVLFPAFVALSLPALSIISLPLVALRFVSLPSRAHWPMATLRTSFFWGVSSFFPTSSTMSGALSTSSVLIRSFRYCHARPSLRLSFPSSLSTAADGRPLGH